MAPRKPKAPEKRRQPLIVRLLSTTALWLGLGARGIGRQAMRNPGAALSVSLFLGVFGTVAANALWYQPQRLQTPFFATRDFNRFDALPGMAQRRMPDPEVTTFKIERADTVVVEGEAAQPAPSSAASASAAAGDETASIIRQAEAEPVQPTVSAAAEPENIALAVAVQQALIRRGLYNGAADGVIGPRTTAAILFFEQTEGLPETGAVSEELLKRLTDGAPPAETTAAISAAAPAGKVPVQAVSAKGGSDDLASLIRASEGTGKAAVPAAAPASPAKPSGKARAAGPEVIARIQAGLARMSYQNSDPEGVAGPGTRAAIRQFQKYYRLPITGEPSAEVLAKLKEIGAV